MKCGMKFQNGKKKMANVIGFLWSFSFQVIHHVPLMHPRKPAVPSLAAAADTRTNLSGLKRKPSSIFPVLFLYLRHTVSSGPRFEGPIKFCNHRVSKLEKRDGKAFGAREK